MLEAVRCRTAKMARARCIARQAVGRHEKVTGLAVVIGAQSAMSD